MWTLKSQNEHLDQKLNIQCDDFLQKWMIVDIIIPQINFWCIDHKKRFYHK